MNAADEFEITRGPFKTMYRGTCTVNRDHEVKPGDLVAVVQRADNPFLPVPGVACYRCIRLMSKAK